MEGVTSAAEEDFPAPASGTSVIHLGYVRLWMGSDGIVYDLTYLEGRLEEEHALRGLAAIARLTNGRRASLVARADRVGSVSKEAREVMIGPQAAATLSSIAIVVGNPVIRVLMTFLVRLSPPPYALRLFSTVREAQAWASAFVERAPGPTG